MKEEKTYQTKQQKINLVFDLVEDLLLVSGRENLSFELEKYNNLRNDHRWEEFKKVSISNPDLKYLKFFNQNPKNLTLEDVSEFAEDVVIMISNTAVLENK